jgi:DNA mismatch endonuclease, patch repair protein
VIVPSGRGKVIFVHGCFWHQHDDPECKIARRPKSNLDYWGPKLDRNMECDKENQAKLRETDWDYFIVWECEAREAQRKGTDTLKVKIRRVLG